MNVPGKQLSFEAEGLQAIGPFGWMGFAAVGGATLGSVWAWFWLWLVLAIFLAVAGLILTRQPVGRDGEAVWWRFRRWTALFCLAAVWATWAAMRVGSIGPHDVRHYLSIEPQLAVVTGTVDSAVSYERSVEGAMAGFDFRPPRTATRIRLSSIRLGDEVRPCSGKLLVSIDGIDPTLKEGERIEATGWVSSFGPPLNPGVPDFRRRMAQHGVYGRMEMANPLNYAITGETEANVVVRCRVWFARACDHALQRGLDDPEQVSLLRRLLLGRRTADDPTDLDGAFRRVGLAHVLSISGAHLSILLALVWLAVRIVTPIPRTAALVVIAVLMLYLAAVPLRVPIVRAAVMATVFCLGFASGRRTPAIDLLGLAAMLQMLIRPGDVLSPGFQLSYGVVAALVVFTGPISNRLSPDPDPEAPRYWADPLRRWLSPLVAANFVAFAAAWPLTAFHFQIVTPWAVFVTLLAVLPVALTLAVGFAKVFIGVALPSLSLILAGPMAWVTSLLQRLVSFGGRWPGSAIDLPLAPSLWWLALSIGVTAAGLAWAAGGAPFRLRPKLGEQRGDSVRANAVGRQKRRGYRWRCAVLICGAWSLVWLGLGDGRLPSRGPVTGVIADEDLNVYALAVADGSCTVIRCGGRTIVMDCGSQWDPDVALRQVVPALHAIGVERIDTLLISHADLDHFVGVLDLVDSIPVGEVLTPAQTFFDVRSGSALAALHDGLRTRSIPLGSIQMGWKGRLGDAHLEALWPPLDWDSSSDNDASLVLRLSLGERAMLLCGDIEETAIDTLLETVPDALAAVVTDLPHHGSFHDRSLAWIEAVGPSVVVQSCGPSRLEVDRWAQAFDAMRSDRPQRWVTARDGAIRIQLDGDDGIAVTSFIHRDGP